VRSGVGVEGGEGEGLWVIARAEGGAGVGLMGRCWGVPYGLGFGLPVRSLVPPYPTKRVGVFISEYCHYRTSFGGDVDGPGSVGLGEGAEEDDDEAAVFDG